MTKKIETKSEDAKLAEARERIAKEAIKKTGMLSFADLTLQNIPNEIFELRHLTHLSFSHYDFVDGEITVLADYFETRKFEIEKDQWENFSKLNSLSFLDICGANISNLLPLSNLKKLSELVISDTNINDLQGIQKLENLESINASSSPLHSLEGIGVKPNLETLVLYKTEISDLTQLASCENLTFLNVSDTNVSDLTSLGSLDRLERLFCEKTKINNFEQLTKLPSLKFLCISKGSAEKLTPLLNIPKLKMVYAEGKNSFDIPAEVYGSGIYLNNCWNALRGHLLDLKTGSKEFNDAKLIVLGNGRIGKTQICNRLSDQSVEHNSVSTHGIQIDNFTVNNEATSQRFQTWDFGGQDIYFSTHALFLKGRSIFLLVWTPEAEIKEAHVHQGIRHENRKLDWWVEYIHRYADKDPRLIVTQTQCEGPRHHATPLPINNRETFESFDYKVEQHVDSFNGYGFDYLKSQLMLAAEDLNESHGCVKIGVGRLRLIRHLESKIAAFGRPDQTVDTRTMTQSEFSTLCENLGDINEPFSVLKYLNDLGIVFYREGLFDDRIILDQNWALNAIYALFDRANGIYNLVSARKGRFMLSDLTDKVWADYGAREQELFLSMMLRCGICFAYKEAEDDQNSSYVAPDLLPEKEPSDFDLQWNPDAELSFEQRDYKVLPETVFRQFMSAVGEEAGIAGTYWRSGFFVYDAQRLSRAKITKLDAETTWAGSIRIDTQDGDRAGLLIWLSQQLNKAEKEARFHSYQKKSSNDLTQRLSEFLEHPNTALNRLKDDIISHATAISGGKTETVKFQRQPDNRPEAFVSYAWASKNPDAPKNVKELEFKVDELFEKAKEHGMRILRDKEILETGDSVSAFMKRLTKGKLVYVFLSDKYLRSENCMFELIELWENCGHQDEKFRERAKVYRLDCAKIFDSTDRQAYVNAWNTKCQNFEKGLEGRTASKKEHETVLRLQSFRDQTFDLLTMIADKIQPESFEEFVEFALPD